MLNCAPSRKTAQARQRSWRDAVQASQRSWRDERPCARGGLVQEEASPRRGRLFASVRFAAMRPSPQLLVLALLGGCGLRALVEPAPAVVTADGWSVGLGGPANSLLRVQWR